MARTHANLNFAEHLKPLSELSTFKIEPGDPDPRGWNVVTTDGRTVGEVDDLVVDTSAMKVRQFIVALSDSGSSSATRDQMVLIDAAEADLRPDARQVIARTFTGTEQAYAATSGADTATRGGVTEGQRTLTRSEEELTVGKREVSTGTARVAKHVETEHVSQPVTRRREELVVERRPVEAGARADASISSDEIHIPLMEEEVVVEKRPVVKEELVVGKRVVEERDVVEADVRREEFDIERGVEPGSSTRRDRH